jgi:hypothetical protein
MEVTMSKQTAVELLEQQLKERYSLMNSEPLFDQAKQMEKEQIIDAHIHAQFKVLEAKREFAQKYFNDFYGGNNE